jgi:polysaccharide export outer membrane protein
MLSASFSPLDYMRNAKLFMAWGLLALALLSGCSRPYRSVLFNTPKKYERLGLAVVHINPDTSSLAKSYQHRIQADDLISLRFLNNFDIAEGLTITESAGQGIPFLVDKEGDVNLPMIGKIKLIGDTKQSAQTKIEEAYSKHFKNPNVEVSILNLSVSVQGEVRTPGIYQLRRERTTLLEVLAAAGGISQFGKEHVVKVVRGSGQDKEPELYIFDLRQIDAVKTSDLVLKDKDVVYVEPRDVQVLGSKIQPYSSFLSILTTVGTLTVVVINITK